MASKYTTHYQLCQWEASDKVSRAEFNYDNAKLDAIIKSVDRHIDIVSDTVDGKADKTALDSLSQTVLQHTSSLIGKGNCQLYTTSYTGTGGSGESSQNSLSFSHKPFAVFVVSGNYVISMFRGAAGVRGLGSAYLTLSWSGNTLNWYSTSALDQLNQQGSRYLVFALLER